MDFLRKLARKINGNPISRNLVLAACAIIVFMCVVNLLLNLFTRHGQVRDVPDFSGMTVEEAVKAGKGASLKIEVNDSLYVPAYPGGVILEQNPSAGARVKSGRHIFVTINSFHQKMVTVPYVTGFSLRQAKNNLEMAGLEIKELIYKSDIATNYVLEERCAGKVVQPGSKLQTEISKSVAGLPYSLSLGGSAGNTIRAMARLGCGTGFIGKVGPDTTGDFFEQALANLGVKPFIFRGSERSGKCVALISPDGERTMITHLGAALELTAADVRADIFEGFDCVYIEGYLVQNHELIEHTARTAKERGLQVAIDLASFNIVKENLDFLRALVEKYVDIVFANEDEAIAFTGENEPINALQAISQLCELAIVKIGIRGALIKHRSEVVHVGIMAAARRVDTTGAGDFYAAGFLYGMCAGLSLRQCGTIGAITAGKVIEVVGTTFGEEAWEDIFRLVKKVRNERYLF